MERLRAPAPADMNPEQRKFYDDYLVRVGKEPVGPVWVWMTVPALAMAATQLGLYVSRDMALPKRLKEIAILVTARRWTAQYEWYAHERMSAAAGVEADIIEAIRHKRRPAFKDAKDDLVFDFATAVMEKGRVDDALYRRAITDLGDRQVVELTTVLGLYAMVSITLNTFEFAIPADAVPLSE